jgi:hypothetical protein
LPHQDPKWCAIGDSNPDPLMKSQSEGAPIAGFEALSQQHAVVLTSDLLSHATQSRNVTRAERRR